MWTQEEIFVGVYNEYEGPLFGGEVSEDGKIYDSWTCSREDAVFHLVR